MPAVQRIISAAQEVLIHDHATDRDNVARASKLELQFRNNLFQTSRPEFSNSFRSTRKQPTESIVTHNVSSSRFDSPNPKICLASLSDCFPEENAEKRPPNYASSVFIYKANGVITVAKVRCPPLK